MLNSNVNLRRWFHI